MKGVRFADVVDGEIVRHAIDQVNNNLSCVLRWCATHVEPVWVHDDDSFTCPHELIVGWHSDGGHDIVDWPFPPAGSHEQGAPG